MTMIKRVAETVNPAVARMREWPTEALLGSRIWMVCIVRPLRWYKGKRPGVAGALVFTDEPPSPSE